MRNKGKWKQRDGAPVRRQEVLRQRRALYLAQKDGNVEKEGDEN